MTHLPTENKPTNCPSKWCIHANCPYESASKCDIKNVMKLDDPKPEKRSYHSFFLDGPTEDDRLLEKLEEFAVLNRPRKG